MDAQEGGMRCNVADKSGSGVGSPQLGHHICPAAPVTSAAELSQRQLFNHVKDLLQISFLCYDHCENPG